MILHDINTDLEGIQPLLAEKDLGFETALLDEAEIKKLVYCEGVIFLGHPKPAMLIMLREMLGRSLLPSNFPVFLNSETTVSIPNNQGLGSLDILSGYDKEKCIDKATGYRSRKVSTGSSLGWATLLLMSMIFFLGIKGAKIFLPPGELETQVENLKINDPSDVYLRLLGPTSKLKERLQLFNKLSSHPDFYFLPLDLSMFLISKRNETQSYLDRVEALLEIPSTLKIYTIEEIEATLLKISQLKDRFPKKWETTEAWVFLLNKELFNQQLRNELLTFYADFKKRNDEFDQLSAFSEKQRVMGFDWKPWMRKAEIFLEDPWPTASYFALSTNIPEILEMRLADYRNREKIRTLNALLIYLSNLSDIRFQDFLFHSDLYKKSVKILEKEIPNWQNNLSLSNFPQAQKEVLQALAFNYHEQIISLLRARILSILGNQKSWPDTKSKIINEPVLKDLALFLQPISLLASSPETKPVDSLISFLSSDSLPLKFNSVKIKCNDGIIPLLTEKPILVITFENISGITKEFSTNLMLSSDKNVLQGSDVGIDYAYKWFDKVKAEIKLKDGLKLVWDKPQLDIFGWSSLLVDGQVVGSSTTAEKLTPISLIFEPALMALPSLLFGLSK